ncbi:MAG TPA: MBL fold metallo-hydrolase [Bacteroidetes bacterium]|nr:MBL fold metallo-hydrolase [Bacteroidota bacterium]
MIHIRTFVFNPFGENTFVLYDDTLECAVVDAGCMDPGEEKELEQFIREQKLKPVLLLNTHCHVDHVAGNGFMKRKYGLLAHCHETDAFLLKDAVAHARMFGLETENPPEPGEFIREDERIRFGETSLQVIHVPGHSPGSVVFYSADDHILLAGDVLFKGGIGRTDLPGGDHRALLKNIREKLFSLPGDTVVYPGHGPATTIGTEKTSNPFFV